MIDEHNLLEALRSQDKQAFTILFDTYSDKIFRLAVGILGDTAEAEVIIQETFLRLFQKLDQFEGRAKLGTWLYRVAHNLCIDQLRKRKFLQSLDDDFEDNDDDFMPAIFVDWSQAPEELFSSSEAQVELEKAISALPRDLRSTFILREIEGLSTAETAEVLDIKPGTVKVRLHRGRLRLREYLSSYFGELIA